MMISPDAKKKKEKEQKEERKRKREKKKGGGVRHGNVSVWPGDTREEDTKRISLNNNPKKKILSSVAPGPTALPKREKKLTEIAVLPSS